LPSELFESVKIPRERIGALIGPEGKVKRKLEKLGETMISVDSETGTVEIEGKGNNENFRDSVNVVRAIGRGFSPENAFLLFGEDMLLHVLKVRDIVGGGQKSLQTKKGRVIGKQGLAREAIEKETDAKISVFGKTVSIIGNHESVEIARQAIEMLLEGAEHKKVMDYLKRSRAERNKFTI